MNETLVTILNIAIVLELSIVNLLSVNSCAKRKYSWLKTLLVLFFSSVFIVGVGFFVISLMKIYGNGNGIFVLFGFLYMIPLNLLYDEKPGDILIIICTAWVYTLGIFSLGVQIGKMFDEKWLSLIVLAFQTITHFSTYIFFKKFIRRIYKYILSNITKSAKTYLRLTSISWFFTLFVVHLSSVMTEWTFLDIVSVVALIWSAGVSYFLLYEMVRGSRDIVELSRSVLYDSLTGLGNRKLFDKEIERFRNDYSDFYLMFLDLDSFKSVNDRFGHAVGDEYLRQFARITRRALRGDRGELFRIAGDEFLGLYGGADIDEVVEKIKRHNLQNTNLKSGFLGVSIGYVPIGLKNSDCVEDLINCADRLMYEEKHSKIT